MYDEFSHLWTQISAPEGYADEAEILLDLAFELLGRERGEFRPSMLEMGVGGGNNLCHMTEHVDAVAADISPQMLTVSQALNPGVEHVIGDMRSMRLGRKFDFALVHDAVSYITTEADLLATFETARAHLEPGGVFIAGPDWLRGVTEIPNISSKLGEPGELSYTEFVHDPDPADTEIEIIFTYFIPNEDGSVRVEEDRHRHGLFEMETWLKLMRRAGFEPNARRYPSEASSGAGYHFTGIAK
ncbi:MAG: class I SAM-dependent methyltransferase [Chloroflexi bacterium]|nr:class I SAM-dependent methyltransferase [Chloroflexota bacterium]